FTGIPTINTLEVFGDSLYVGGGFDSISSQERKNVCAFNLATDSLTSWAPKPNGRVFDFHKEGNELVISGSFNSISGITANSVAKIDIHTAVITPINLDFTGVVYGITQLKNKWLVSTSIDSYVGNRRNGLAALDLNTRRITNWDPKLNGENVFNMTQLDSTIFVKGSFDSVGNVSRETIAQISLNSGLATNWDVDWTVAQSNPYRSINNIWVHDSLIYLSGGFDTINGLPRNGLAAFSINTGSLSPTSINLDSPIYGGEILNNTLYFYGFFNTVNGISRKNAAAINLLNGTITPWNPDPSDRIYALGIKDASVILAGSFEDLGGVARKRLAAVDTTLGNPNSWNPHPNNSCLNYFNLGNMSLITGVFNSIGQTKRKNLAAVDLTTNELLDWNPNTNNFVTSLEIIDSNLYVGGHFDSIDYSARSGLAAFSLDSGNLNNTSFGNLGDINCLGHSKGYLYYGGDLNTWETGVDRINITNSSTVSWNAYLSTNAEVSSIGFDTNTVYVGGLFTKSFPTRTNIAAFSTLDATNQPMNAAPNGAVKSIAVGDNELFIAGDFTMIGTSVFTNFAKLVKSTGSAFSSYNSYVPNFYGSNPKSVMLKGDTLFYGGSQKTTKVNKSNGTIYGDFLNSPDEVLTMMTASDSLFLCGENLSNADDKPGVEVWENCQPTFYTDIQFSCTEYTWINGVTYNQSNFTDSVIVPNYWGCDSIVKLNLTIDSSRCVYVIDSVLTCVRAYTWDDGVTYYDSGYVGQQLLWRDGFQDSVVSLYIGWETSNMAFSTDTVISCDLNYLWFDGQTYTAGGNVGYMSYSLSNGCDSIVKLDLTLDSSNLVMVYDTNFFCDSLLWLDGNTYYANNNTAQQISSNNSGCDTLKTLFAFQRYPTTGIDTVNACNYYAWLDGNIYVSNNNTATHTLTTAYGCDSVVTLNLTMGYPSSGVDTQMVCDSLIWLDGNTYYSNNTTATYALQGGNAAGCDSIVTLHLTILNSPITVVSETACDSFAWNGVTYYSSIYTPTDTLINVAGCDSVLNLNLTIGYSSIDTDTITACDSYTWVNGITYYANNTTAVDTLITAVGCDSIVYLDLTILKIDSTVIQSSDTLKAVASGLSYQWIECASNTVINGAISQEYVPSVTGNYKVEITNLICTDTSACFQVNLCANQSSYTFTDNGSGDFYFTDNSIGIYTQVHWSFGDGATSTGVNPNHIYQANGNYVVVLTINDSNASAQCVSYFMDTINVLGVGTPVICQAGFSVYYDSVNATVNVANSSVGSNLTYLWDFGDGTSSSLQFPSHSYATNGPFNLCLTIDDGNGCTDTYCDSISNQGVWFRASGFDLIVEGAEPVSASEMNLSNNINIYPNPVHDQVNIEITNWPTNEVEIVVRDMVGMKVFTQSVEPISNSETITINTSKWAKGTYFIEVSDEVNRVTEKIVVQ
ncbi:MAG: PKD repeat protein, partial [Salibacteraceae bacterium]